MNFAPMKVMKKAFFALIITSCSFTAKSQKIDSIFFNLYTDSLKKGVHNYISVDAKMSDGNWRPLTAKEIEFTSNYGKFEGNDLVLPDTPTTDRVKIKIVLRSDPKVWKETIVWIKQRPDDEALPTTDEILRDLRRSKKKN